MTDVLTPYVPQDAAEVAALISALYPDRAIGGDELVRQDRDQQEVGCHHGRVVARSMGGRLLGFAAYKQSLGQYHPRKVLAEVLVAPEARRQGLGGRLADWLEGQLRPMELLSVRSTVRETPPEGLAFAHKRGFQEDKRSWVSSVDPRTVDLSGLPALEARLAEQGVRLLSAAELQAQSSEQHPDAWKSDLHALFSEVRLDVPRSEPPTPISLEQFCTWILDDPSFSPHAYLLAQSDHGELIGQSAQYPGEGSPDLFIGLTGVRRPWRGLGVATAMKLHSLKYAVQAGFPRVWTDNESGNAPILAINDRLGFVRAPAMLSVLRVLSPEQTQPDQTQSAQTQPTQTQERP